jgi:hypothetical protein
MNNSIHAGMDQAGELEVALSGKTYGVGASVTWQDAAASSKKRRLVKVSWIDLRMIMTSPYS